MNGILHDIYHLVDADGNPIPGTGSIWPTLAEYEAYARNDGSTVEVWTPEPQFPLYSQRNSVWKDHPLGGPPLTGGIQTTIGQYGCVITALAMGLTGTLGKSYTPDEVNDAIKAVGGFSGINRNLLMFNKVLEALPVGLLGVYTCATVPAPVDIINDAVSMEEIVLIKIDMDLTDPDVDSHYLLVVGGDSDTRYICHDPWLLPKDQRPIELPPAYCKQGWDAARAIFAAVIFTIP